MPRLYTLYFLGQLWFLSSTNSNPDISRRVRPGSSTPAYFVNKAFKNDIFRALNDRKWTLPANNKKGPIVGEKTTQAFGEDSSGENLAVDVPEPSKDFILVLAHVAFLYGVALTGSIWKLDQSLSDSKIFIICKCEKIFQTHLAEKTF